MMSVGVLAWCVVLSLLVLETIDMHEVTHWRDELNRWGVSAMPPPKKKNCRRANLLEPGEAERLRIEWQNGQAEIRRRMNTASQRMNRATMTAAQRETETAARRSRRRSRTDEEEKIERQRNTSQRSNQRRRLLRRDSDSSSSDDEAPPLEDPIDIMAAKLDIVRHVASVSDSPYDPVTIYQRIRNYEAQDRDLVQ